MKNYKQRFNNIKCREGEIKYEELKTIYEAKARAGTFYFFNEVSVKKLNCACFNLKTIENFRVSNANSKLFQVSGSRIHSKNLEVAQIRKTVFNTHFLHNLRRQRVQTQNVYKYESQGLKKKKTLLWMVQLEI